MNWIYQYQIYIQKSQIYLLFYNSLKQKIFSSRMNQFYYDNQILNYNVLTYPIYPTIFSNQSQLLQNLNQSYCSNYNFGYYPQGLKNQPITNNLQNIQMVQSQKNENQLPRRKSQINYKKMMSDDSDISDLPSILIRTKRIYLKKNTESNISNQVLSYLFFQTKSKDYLKKYLTSLTTNGSQKLKIFYQYMKIIKSYTKTYSNKKELLRLCFFGEQQHPACKEMLKKTKKLEILSIEQFRKIIRILIRNFLNNHSVTTILYSKKIHKNIQKEHFKRLRQIKEYLRHNLKIKNNFG